MQYKNNVLDKLTQTDNIIMRLQLQVNRGMSQNEILETIESLKDSVEGIRDMISVESDDFAQQFAKG